MSSREIAERRVLPTSKETAGNHSQNRAQVLMLAFCVSLSTAIALGFGRFGYSLVLPAMREDLNWTYKQAGALEYSAGWRFHALRW